MPKVSHSDQQRAEPAELCAATRRLPLRHGRDPVALSTGLFTLEATDLAVTDVLPIAVTRTYRQRDVEARAFGVGMTHPYAMFLWSALQYQEADLVLPDGAKIHYVRISPGSGFTDAVFAHQETATTTATPTAFYKSIMLWNGNGWNVTLKDGSVFIFGENAPLQAIRDRSGNQITIAHANGQSGNVTQVTTPNGRWIAFTYDDSSRVIQVKDNIGRTVGYAYDNAGNLATVTDPVGHVTSYTYDGSHSMLTVKTPTLQGTALNLVTNEYTTAADAPTPAGWVKKQTHVDGGIYQFAYTFASGKISRTDVTAPNNRLRRVSFNENGYVTSHIHAYGETGAETTTSERHAGTNLVAASTNARGNVTTATYDALGNLRTVTRLPGTVDEATTTYTYDPVFNQVATITDALRHKRTFEYDVQGNRKGMIDALNHKTSFTYNASGQVTSMTDPLLHTTTFEYSGPDLIKVTDPAGRVTQQFSDGAGCLLSQTDALGQKTRFAYDKVNHVTQVTDAMGNVTAYGYDSPGRLQTVTDAQTHATTYGYDQFDRLASRIDPLGNAETFSYDLLGNPAQRTDRKGQLTSRTYDLLNRLYQVTYADNSTVTYTYDSAGRLTTIDDSLNGPITRTYDDLNRLTAETTLQGTIGYTFDKADRRTTMTVTGQPTVSYGYDDANRLTSIGQGASVVTIAYDDADRRSSLTLPNGIVTTSEYDQANYLTSLTYTLGQTTLGTLTYTYDLAGRRTQVGGTWARTGLPGAVASATFDAANRLTQWSGQTFSYDLNGNLASDGLTSYAWNPRNQLSGMSGAASISYQYDGRGRRQSRTLGSTSTSFLYDADNLVQELSGTTPTANLLTGTELDQTFTRSVAGGTSTFLSDALGSVVALADVSGSVQAQYTFAPFGATTASGTANSNPLQFTGRENDGAGLYNYRARYYNPALHRFISEDEVGDTNLYAYAQNRPTSLVDPLGLTACAPECFAQLKYRPTDATGTMNHAFWYVQGSDGQQYILSGGRAAAGGVGEWATPISPGASQLLAPVSWSIGPSADVCDAVDKMIRAALSWPSGGVGDYWWEGPNSNSAAKYLGTLAGFSPGAPPLTKGWESPLPRR